MLAGPRVINAVLSAAICLIVLAQFQFMLARARAEGSPEELQIINQSSYIDESKIMHVYAAIKNDLQSSRKNIVVTANFYDKGGASVGSSNGSAALNQLDPGDIAPVEVQLLSTSNASRVANHSLEVSSEAAEPPLLNRLQILSANSRLDLLGTYYINLVAQNQANITASNALAVATLYDKDGRVIAIGKALAEAVPGSADIPPNSTAAFGIAITEKLETYKAVRYAIVLQSDQFKSTPIELDTKSGGYSASPSHPNTVSRCLIATAAFGSDMAPEVQSLRDFRDGVALRTFAGSNFMLVFNNWYYSFSPQVADYERASPWMQEFVRTSIQPLILALDVGREIDNMMAGSTSPELAIIVSGLVVSLLLGAVYLTPIAGSLALATRRRWTINVGRGLSVLILAFCIGAAALLLSVSVTSPLLAMLGSSAFVLAGLVATPLSVVWIVRR